MYTYSQSDLSESEKIDHIHSMLVANQRARNFGIFVRVLLVILAIYGYHYFSLPENAEQKARIMSTVRQKFSEFVTPIVNDIMGDVLKNMALPKRTSDWSEASGSSATVTPNITPEMIKAVQDSMKKE